MKVAAELKGPLAVDLPGGSVSYAWRERTRWDVKTTPGCGSTKQARR